MEDELAGVVFPLDRKLSLKTAKPLWISTALKRQRKTIVSKMVKIFHGVDTTAISGRDLLDILYGLFYFVHQIQKRLGNRLEVGMKCSKCGFRKGRMLIT